MVGAVGPPTHHERDAARRGTVLFSGLLLVAVSAGLFAGQTWARVAAIVIVIVHAVTQILWLDAFPLWSLPMIGLDAVVLFALTPRWSAAQEA